MKKTLFIILALCSMSYGLSGYSMYKIYKSGDTVTAINLDSNFVRGSSWSNKLADTIDRNFIRWYDFNSHDSTLRYFKVDTIRSNPNIDSITGDITITGSPTITGALTVDSLKSTKGINATDGTFSGALTGATLNTGNGANELYPMDQDQRTTASPTHVLGTYTDGVRAYNNTGYGSFIGMFKSIGMLPGYPSANYPVVKTDYNYVLFSTNNKYCASIGEEYFDIRDTSIECPVFRVDKDTTKMHIAEADSIKLGTGSYLKNYVEGTLPCTLKTSDVTVQQVGTITYTIIGNVVHLTFPFIYGTSNSPYLKLYCGGLTGELNPSRVVCSDVPYVTDNGVSYKANVIYRYGTGNYFDFVMISGSYTSSGSKGVGGWLTTNKTTITYTK